MKSWWMQMDEAGSRLELRDVPVPQPDAQQLVVRMRAAGLNRGEFVAGHGLHGKPGTWKAIGGEGAGDVVAVGADVKGFKPGDAVMGRCAGAFSEYALMEQSEAIRKPQSLSWQEAASIPLTYLVAFDMLVLQGRLQPGEWLLINGVSSGVGVASHQLGKALGAKVIGTSGSRKKLDALQPFGLDLAICTRAADFGPAVMEATQQRGANLVVNAVGGSVFAENIRSMAFEGRLATVGYVDGVLHGDLDLEALHARRLVIFGVSNKMRTKAQRSAAVPAFTAQVMPLIASGRIKALVDEVVPFDRMPIAREHMEAGTHVGKIVLAIEETK
jgi:NADPH:quinone reductase-like Zn-dependent oxidoreductase